MLNQKMLYAYHQMNLKILNMLIDSLLEYFNDKLMVCRTDSSYVFESVEGFSIHFHKIDLRSASSYIPTPDWLEAKKQK